MRQIRDQWGTERQHWGLRGIADHRPSTTYGTRPPPKRHDTTHERFVANCRCRKEGSAPLAKPAERSAEGAEPLYLIPRKQVGIREGELRRSGRAGRKSAPAKRQARARAANARWEKYARQQSDLVESLRKIKRYYFGRLADQVEQCHRSFRGCQCGNGHMWAKPAFSCKCRLCPFEMRARSMAAQHKFGKCDRWNFGSLSISR